MEHNWRQLSKLVVATTHPEDYVLINEQDGTRWRGSATGWKSEPVPTPTIQSSDLGETDDNL